MDKKLSSSIHSEIIPIPADVIQYLLSDGIVLPKSARNGQYHQRNSAELSSDSEDGVEWDEDSEEEDRTPSFPHFEEKVTTAIDKLGGRVFPKLNWSSPRDAAWVGLNNSLMCQSLGDVLLLLKSSDFITRDLTQPYVYCDNCSEAGDVDYDLVLRRWEDVSPSGEFRCFVKDRDLIGFHMDGGTIRFGATSYKSQWCPGICQRAQNVHFPHMERQEDTIVHDVMDFYHRQLREKFPDDDYVFDIYRREEGKVKLVDLNPFGDCTDSLLYSWSELKTLASQRVENSLPDFRHGENCGVQPGPFQAYALPRDIVHLCGGVDANKLIDVMRLHENIADSSSDEDVP